MRCLLLLSLTAIALSAGGPNVCAQRNPPMAEQQRDAEKERYYATFNTHRRIPLQDSQRRAYEAAVEYLKRFEGDRDADARTVRQFVIEYERGGTQAKLLAIYNSKEDRKSTRLNSSHSQISYAVCCLEEKIDL